MMGAGLHGRSSLLLKLGFGTLVVLVVLLILLAYAQTRHAFRHVLIPLAAQVTGARLDVRDGRLSLRGALEAEGLVYEDRMAGVAFDVERVALTVQPWSFLQEGVPRIDDFELQRVHLRIVYRPDAAEDVVERPGTTDPLPLWPVAIGRARFEDVAFTIEREDTRITGRTGAEIDQLLPGKTGTVKLKTDFVLSDAGEEEFSGGFDLALSVAAGPSGMPLTWNGTNLILIRRGELPLSDDDSREIRFDQTLEGELTQIPQRLRLSSTVAVHRDETALGTVAVTAATDMAAKPAVTDITLTAKGLTADPLNLLLGRTEARMHGGRFDAGLEAHVEGTRSSMRATMTGSRVQFRMGNRQMTPAVDVSLQHAGAFDSATRDLFIERLTIAIGDDVVPVLSGDLDRPFSIRLLPSEEHPPGFGSSGTPAVWSMRLSPTRIQSVRPWLAVFGAKVSNEVEEGTIGGAMAVTVHEQGALVEVTGRLDASDVILRGDPTDRAGRIGPLGIVTDGKGRITGLRTLSVDPLTTSVRLKGKQVASMRLTGTGTVADARTLTALESMVTLEGLPGEALNPLLALWSSGRIARARIDGRAELTVDERSARWKADLHGQDVQLRLQDMVDDGSSLDWRSQFEGEFKRTSRELGVGRLNIELADRRHALVTLALDQPLIMKVGSNGSMLESPPGRRQSNTLSLRVNRPSVHQLDAWMALAGGRMPDSIRDGSLDADVTVTLGDDDHITVAGRLDLEQLVLEGISAPITVGTNGTASLTGRSHITVEEWDVQAFDGTRLLARARLAGSAGFDGATDVRIDLAADDPTALIGRLGLLTHRQQEVLSGGRLSGEVRVAAVDSSAPWGVKADLRSSNLTLGLDKSRRLTRTVGLHADIDVDAARTVADIHRLELTVDSEGAGTGTLTMNGRWPVTEGHAGAISLAIKEWDSGPLMEFFGWLPGRIPGPLPVTAEITVTRDADAKMWAVRGKESIGPMRATVNGRPLEPATLHLQNDVVRTGEEIRVTTLTFAADRPAGQNDHLSVSGTVRTGSQPRIEAGGVVDRLDADWYAALAAPASPQSSPPGQKETADAGLPPIPLNLDVDVAVGTVIYRNVNIGQGRLIAKGDGRHLQATVEPTGLAGGTVQGSMTISIRDGQPEFAWDLKGSALDVGTLSNAGVAGTEPPMTGRGTFTAAGTGRGRNKTLRRSLKASVFFDVTDGQFNEVPVLDFLADQTHIEAFRGLGFRTLHGALDVKNGWVTVQEFRVEGPVAGIEAEGKLALDGRLDLRVEPKIGPAISQHVSIPCLDQLARTAEGFTQLPLAVTVNGTAAAPSYGVAVTPGSLMEREAKAVVGTLADLFTGCRGGDAAQRATEEAIGAVKDTAKDFIGDLFGRKQKP